MGDHAVCRFLCVFHTQESALGRERAGVPALAARLCIKRSAPEKHLDLITLDGPINGLAVLAQTDDRRLRRELAVARELRFRQVLQRRPTAWELAAGALPLRGHRALEAVLVDLQPALLR